MEHPFRTKARQMARDQLKLYLRIEYGLTPEEAEEKVREVEKDADQDEGLSVLRKYEPNG